MTKIALIILDGFGIRKETEYNAVKNAKMPFFNSLTKKYSHTKLKTCAEYVGLDAGQFGNSEVGHLNMGAGRIVKQNSMRISESIKNESFFDNKTLISMIKTAKKNKSNLHILGLCSDGGVHSKLSHLVALLKLCKKLKFKDVFIHFIADGRDTDIHSGKKFYTLLQKEIKKINIGKIISVTGRFYAMDREKNYERTEKFFNVLTKYDAKKEYKDLKQVFDESYSNNISDEFIEPSILENTDYSLTKKDVICCFNFRSDRARQIYELLVKNNYKNLFSFIQYDTKFNKIVKVAFPEENNKNCLSEVLSKNNKSQLRISETTKYAHVTYFFNLLIEKPFKNEKRIIIDSENVDNFAKTPKMKAGEITKTIIAETDKNLYDFILVNYSNADMLGHTGDYKATIKSLEFLDKCLKTLVNNLKQKGYTIIITADHGNADKMKYKNGNACTTHTISDAPFIIVDENKYNLIKNGKLANISPTILDLFKIKLPKEFNEKSLILNIDN